MNYLDISDTVDKCDEYLNKVMILIQELEGKFAEFDDYTIQLGEKREELYNAFETKKQAIIDKQNKRIVALFSSAERILSGIENRVKNFTSVQEIHGYLATDIMVEKVRDVIASLNELGDSVKAEEVTSRLKKMKEDATRQLLDRKELYVNGDHVIKFGKHHFSVNTKAIDLSIVQKEDGLFYHITGTDFWERIDVEGIASYAHVFHQSILSENQTIYRAEYLAYKMFQAAKEKQFENLDHLTAMTEANLVEMVQKFMESRYQEGYTKGVHDIDGAKILSILLDLHKKIELLIYTNECRAMARLYWNHYVDKKTKEVLRKRLQELSKVSAFFGTEPKLDHYVPYVIERLEKQEVILGLFDKKYIQAAAEYLCLEIMRGESFVVSKEAKSVYDEFMAYLRNKNIITEFQASLDDTKNDLEGQYYWIQECVNAYKESATSLGKWNEEEINGILKEVIVLLMGSVEHLGRVIYIDSKVKISGLTGTHDVITQGEYELSYTRFMNKLTYFEEKTVPDFLRFQEMKKELIQNFKLKIHLDDFKPKVLSSFVRNQLIDKVYLPIIGDNLAKQIGVVGENKRTDLMGLLLLLSPPGYGKTTLMEYIASRLGIILVKINGPSLGHEVTSLDPALAKNIGAREELVKLNVALKMGNNVMIYIDDIQHCNPEFLQKFISLCDGQREIDGVYQGVGQSYDLRGKKVAVVMAGNPYTESGEKFKIPDMLANRADVYNLGDMLRENEEAFKLSYLENCVTSNPILAKLSTGSTKDLYGFVEMAKGTDRENINFEGNYSMDEMNEYISVISKLFKVRDIVLKVNLEYIYSAAQADEYRNEPPFKLQGSYRNMNKIAEKVVPIMNDEELFQRVLASYENDAQTLATGAEANMLKWKDMAACITDMEKQRFEEIKGVYMKNKLVKGDDKLGQAVLALSNLTEHLEKIKDILGNESFRK